MNNKDDLDVMKAFKSDKKKKKVEDLNFKIKVNNKVNRENRSFNKNNKKLFKFNNIQVKFFIVILIIIAGIMIYSNFSKPALVLRKFYKDINDHKYEDLYNLVITDMSKDEFINKLKSVYDGIEVSSAWISISINFDNDDDVNLRYITNLNTIAGKLTFSNRVNLIKINRKV
jgi:peptidoglycan glycosyltransferase